MYCQINYYNYLHLIWIYTVKKDTSFIYLFIMWISNESTSDYFLYTLWVPSETVSDHSGTKLQCCIWSQNSLSTSVLELHNNVLGSPVEENQRETVEELATVLFSFHWIILRYFQDLGYVSNWENGYIRHKLTPQQKQQRVDSCSAVTIGSHLWTDWWRETKMDPLPHDQSANVSREQWQNKNSIHISMFHFL